MRLYLAHIVCFVAFCQCLYAQTGVVDSLEAELKKHPKNDTIKVNLLNTIGSQVWGSNPQLTKEYANKALQISKGLNYTRGLADSYKGLTLFYWSQTDYDKATDYALMALKEYERCNDLKGVSWCYASIGTSYSQANDYDKALYYHGLALDLNKKIGNKTGIGRNLNSFGYVHELKKDYNTALEFYYKALDLRIELGDKNDLTLSYSNVGSIYYFLEKYPQALDYLFKALPMAKEINNKNYIALIYQNIGEVYYKIGKYKDGEFYLKNALSVGTEIGDKKRREGVYEALKNLEDSRKNYEAAYRYLTLLQGLRDTLYTQDRSQKMAEMETRYETEKKEQTIKLLEQEDRMHRMWRNVLISAIILALFVAFIIYRLQRSRTLKAKELLEIQHSLNDKLQEVDKLKSRFFANISHEFRTPLTLLLAPIEEKLLATNLVASEKDSLLLMKRNANRLLELVNQLLDISKLESGKMKLVVKPGDLKAFMRILSASFDSLAENKKIRFIKNITIPDQEYWFDADVIEKIINNLLSNAFKFTRAQGAVSLVVQPEVRPTESGTYIKIIVSDTGMGIPIEDQSEIFSPFFQGKNTAEDGQVGTGLGLSLVKELSKVYGGSIHLVSEVNKGTSITLIIPVGKENFSADNRVNKAVELRTIDSHLMELDTPELLDNGMETENEDAHTDVVLVVEDNSDLRNFIITVLQKEFTVITAVNGKDGIEQALQYVPSLILSDLMMPIMDGLALTEKIKSDERTSHIPVVLLTAKNEQESRLEGFKIGADEYLTKPFSTQELLVRISNLIEQRKRLAFKYKERITVLPTQSQGASLDERFLQKARSIVEANMGEFGFCVETMADEIHLSRTQLLRKLKALTGFSPNEFIKDLRLKKAAELIHSNADTITQIGYAVGFKDQSYFTKCFKKQFGVSPSEYNTAEESAL